jgi:DNA mismatch endonuclease, patch repair protein
MSRIRGSDTKIELLVRRGLHRLGFRYRLGGAALPGRPDITLPKYRAVVFVHGCFWHGHNCHLFRLPKTRTQFWKDKIESNVSRDSRVVEELRRLKWRVVTIWECELRGKTQEEQRTRLNQIANKLRRLGQSA